MPNVSLMQNFDASQLFGWLAVCLSVCLSVWLSGCLSGQLTVAHAGDRGQPRNEEVEMWSSQAGTQEGLEANNSSSATR